MARNNNKNQIEHSVLAVIGIALTVLVAGNLTAAPMGSVVTYQGHLEQTVVSGGGGIGQQPASSQSPANGNYDFRFTIYDSTNNPGVVIAGPLTNSATVVSNGWFTVTLDFGAGAFNGDARWLEIGVRTNGSGAFTELAPRQEAPLMPYALYAAQAGGAAATNVAGLGSSAFQDTSFFDPAGAGTAAAQSATNAFGNTIAADLTNAANQVAGTFAGNGAGVTNLNSQDFTNASRLGYIVIPNPMPTYNDFFGQSVAAVGTNQFVIGAYRKTIGGNASVGQAYLYDTTGTLLATITNPAPAYSDYFGYSVAAAGTNQFVIGAYNKTIGGIAGVGQAYLYDTTGTLPVIITNPVPATGDYFGYSVAGVGTNQFVIGADNKTIGGIAGVGQAYLYDTTGTLQTIITNPAPAANDYFGDPVAGVGTNQFVIGASGKTIGGIAGVGQAYLYDTTGTLPVIITNPAPATNDYFGYSVAGVGTNQFVIGANSKTIGGIAGVGQAYLYDTTGTLLATITNPVPAANSYFGWSVAGVGTNQFVIGAANSQAFLYDTTGTLLATITNPVPAAGDYFGRSVAGVGTNQFVIGAYYKPILGIRVGQAYLYGTIVSVPGLIADGVAPNSIGLEQLNVISVDTRYVLKTGDTITGPLSVLAAVTASSFIGNGSGLTNIPTSGVSNFLGSVTNVVTAATNKLATTDYVNAATNNFGNTVAVKMTNAANQFTGTFTNGAYYRNGIGLTNIPISGVTNFPGSVTNVVTNVVTAATNKLATTNYVIAATNNFGNSVAVKMTNAANQFTGTFTNGVYYRNGVGLTNIAAIKVATNASHPAVVAGSGYFWPSNYNLYWVTPTKTNLIVVGQ